MGGTGHLPVVLSHPPTPHPGRPLWRKVPASHYSCSVGRGAPPPPPVLPDWPFWCPPPPPSICGCRAGPAAGLGAGAWGTSLCCPARPDGRGLYLVVDEDLHGIVAPLDEDQLVGLAGHGVGEGRAHPGGRAGLEPHAHGEGVHLWQALLHLGVHVVGPQWECELELVPGAVVLLTWREQDTVPSSAPQSLCSRRKPIQHSPPPPPPPPPPALGSQEQTHLHSLAAEREAQQGQVLCPARGHGARTKKLTQDLLLSAQAPTCCPWGGWDGGRETTVGLGRE